MRGGGEEEEQAGQVITAPDNAGESPKPKMREQMKRRRKMSRRSGAAIKPLREKERRTRRRSKGVQETA